MPKWEQSQGSYRAEASELRGNREAQDGSDPKVHTALKRARLGVKARAKW
jgi:hypothetical protein